MEGIIALLIPIIFLGGLFTLVAMKLRYNHFRDTRISGEPQPQVEHLTEVVDSLRAEVEQLTERVDFTERLLERPKTAD